MRWRVAGVAMVALVATLALPAGSASTVSPPPAPPVAGNLTVEVIATYPHDPNAFTQGLELHEGRLYEGTGRYGLSDMRVVEVETGAIEQLDALPPTAFGEGITIVDDQVWQLTWQEQYAFRRDRDTLAVLEEVPYQGEGWGICHDPDADRLVMSDGTAELTFRDPDTFSEQGTVTVTRDGAPLFQINELECVDGAVWANVWLTDEIVRIDPASGEVTATVDASGLLTPAEQATADVLNGIAAVPGDDTFFITGKLWPHLFQVRFVPAP